MMSKTLNTKTTIANVCQSRRSWQFQLNDPLLLPILFKIFIAIFPILETDHYTKIGTHHWTSYHFFTECMARSTMEDICSLKIKSLKQSTNWNKVRHIWFQVPFVVSLLFIWLINSIKYWNNNNSWSLENKFNANWNKKSLKFENNFRLKRQ